MICRKCREYIYDEDNYVRKSTRHNYHWNCLFEGKADWEKRNIVFALPLAFLRRIPHAIPKQHGIEEWVREALGGSNVK